MDLQVIYFLLGVSGIGVCWKASPVIGCWARARRARASIPMFTLWWLYFCNVPIQEVTAAYAKACEAGASIPLSELTEHAKAGGDVRAVVHAYVEILQAGSRIDFSRICEIELEEEE
jgi:uncharacterized protein YqfA (UPF0365 family)